MPRRPRPELDDAERAALDAARSFYLTRSGARFPSAKAFSDLRSAAAIFSRRLEPLLSDGPERTYLLSWMSYFEGSGRLKQEWAKEFARLPSLLASINRACNSVVTTGRAPDRRVQFWIQLAAGHWEERLGKKPSYAETGNFLRALDAFHRQYPDVPAVSVSQLRTALKPPRS